MRKYAALCIMLLLAVFLTGTALAEKKAAPKKEASKELSTLNGEVLSVDAKAKTVTVKTIETTTSSPTRTKGEVLFATNKATKISIGKKSAKLADIKAGDKAEVKFHEKDGKPVADQITITEREKPATPAKKK